MANPRGVIAGILMLLVGAGNAYKHMSEQCGGTINAGRSGGNLDSQSRVYYDNNVNCTVVITADIGRQILLTFSTVDIKGGQGCKEDYLQVYEGKSVDVSSTLRVICGNDDADIVSSTNAVTLKFKTDSSSKGKGFYTTYTSFKRIEDFMSCDSDEFECNNKRCIDKNLKNNNFDNCGDYSDEDLVSNFGDTINKFLGLATGALIGIIVGAILVVVLICVCVGCICYHCCCKKTQPQTSYKVVSQTQQQQQQPPMAMQPTGQPVYPPGQPAPYPGQQV
ncbi:low-density lipoprotein receptor-related protein 12-like isoform X2 [Acanthaster planci]|uniref:Low-density lipoprotein receptor-related protein 12-like isoform X2 n=1 Tax=Acanthaster planci TaxID=133434 RepID=A0A8B7XTE7_ACAPL|nr:low-density lipoprotein receptor-related protein 12-like isoform X2 [Acanthaster planci]